MKPLWWHLSSCFDLETPTRTRKQEPVFISPTSLVIAARAKSGEIVIVADRRTAVPLGDEGDKLIRDDKSCKLIDFSGAVIGVAGKCCDVLRVIRQFIAEDTRDADSCDRLAMRLVGFYETWYSADRTTWPIAQVTYCDWLGGRGRIILLSSRHSFVPEDVGAYGNGALTTLLYSIFGVGSGTVPHIERFCLLSLVLNARSDTSVGGGADVWVLSQDGLTKRTDEQIMVTLTDAIVALAEAKERLYP